MKDNFSNKHRKFSIRKLKIGIASVVVGLAFTDALIGVNHVEASMSVEDANYVNQTAVDNASLVEYIHQALETIAKGAKSTVLPTSIQNLKNKVQALSTKQESDYEASAWQEFQEKLTTAKSKLEEVENTYNEAVKINSNAQAYDTTIKELIASYPEYNTVVITVRDGETEDTAGVRHISNLRRINGVLTAKYAELRQIASSMKSVLPPVGEDLAAQQLKKLESAETILEVNKKTATVAESEHQDLMAGLFENNKVVLSDFSTLRGEITPADQTKITTFLKSHVPSLGETAVFQTYAGALQYRFNNDGTLTITYTDDGSSDTVPLSIFAKGGAVQTDSPATTYSVTYHYVSGTPDKSLPSNITAPEAVSAKHSGEVVASPTGQTDVADSANQGTWHFSAWDKASVTIGTTNEIVTGTWEFIPTPPVSTYSVTYHYVSGTEGKSLPSNITAPEAVSAKHPGEVVASPTGQTDVEDTANKGVWRFTSWDKASVTVGTADETVTGTWTFTATPESTPGTTPATTYSVTYRYISGTESKLLPSNITAPEAVSAKHPGEVVASPTGQTDVEDTANKGVWRFTSWDKASVTVGTADETVTGTWTFTATPESTPGTTPATTYSVTYRYISGTESKLLPSNITAPEAVSAKHPGEVVASPTGQTDVEDTANKGVWHFASWDKASVTVGTADEIVTGTWTFTATPEITTGTTPTTTYSVTYRYISGTEDKLLPSNITAGWIKKDGRWWYQHADGSYTTNGWEQIEGIWYHFDQSGWMQTGWIKTGDSWYYLNKSGSMAIGWVKDNGIWYYLNNSGAMKTGWFKDNTTWYYLDNSGAMKTGWFKVSGKWYYAYSSGALAVDTITPDGYKVSANGEWVEDR